MELSREIDGGEEAGVAHGCLYAQSMDNQQRCTIMGRSSSWGDSEIFIFDFSWDTYIGVKIVILDYLS